MLSLIKKISFSNKEKFDYKEVTTLNNDFLNQDLGVYLYFKGTNYHTSELEGIAFSNELENYYIKKENLFNLPNIKEYLENDSYKKSCYDIKASMIMLKRLGIEAKGFDFDFKLACYLLDSSMKDDIYAVFNTIGVILPDIKDENNLGEYSSIIASNSYKLKEELINKMKEKEVYNLFTDLEMPLVYTLIDMESNGVKVDKSVLDDLGVEFRFNK
jgi:DNA polymerase-1